MNKHLKNIDYESLLNIILEEKDYEDLVMIGNHKTNLLDDPIYRKSDEILKRNFDNAIANGIKGEFWEQDKKANTFRHLAINRTFNEGNKLRLYLCPKDESLYFIVNDLLKRCSKTGESIYLKYSRENRYDKIVIFLKNPKDLSSKLRILEEIKNENPTWFLDMKKADTWISESSFKGAFIAPEKITKKDINFEYKSYTIAFRSLMGNVRNEIMFYFKILDFNELKKIPHSELMKVFQYFFLRELGKMGLLIYFDQQNQLVAYTNLLFPGFGKSVDEDIRLTKYGLEIGKRIDQNNKEYFKIPFGANIPESPDEFKKFDSYIMDDTTAFNMKMYPNLYKEKSSNNQGSGLGDK